MPHTDIVVTHQLQHHTLIIRFIQHEAGSYKAVSLPTAYIYSFIFYHTCRIISTQNRHHFTTYGTFHTIVHAAITYHTLTITYSGSHICFIDPLDCEVLIAEHNSITSTLSESQYSNITSTSHNIQVPPVVRHFN
jgi:hypothetical protein